MESLNFIIVGASIAGLSSAITLRASGHNVLVLEKESQLGGTRSMKSGCARVPPNGCKILVDWGLEAEIRAKGADATGFHVYKYNTPEDSFLGTNRWDPEMLEDARGHFVQILYEDLLDILYDAAIDLPGRMESQIKVTPNGADASPKVVVQLGAEVVEVDCDVCSVTLKSGEIHTADAIIGADGAHGVVRRKLLEDEGVESAQGVPTGLSLYSATIPKALAAKEGLDIFCDSNTVWMGSNRSILTFYTGNENDIAIIVYTPDGPQNGCWSQEANLKLPDIIGPCDIQLQKLAALTGSARCIQIQEYPQLESWVSESGRVLVLGEAAHPFPPAALHTCSIALEDGAFIGKIFSHTRDRERVPEFLNAFAEHRGPRCSRTVDMEKQIIGALTLPDGEFQAMRDAGMRACQAAGRNVMDAGAGDMQDIHDDMRTVFGYEPEDDADEWWMTWGRYRDSTEQAVSQRNTYISWTAISSQTSYDLDEDDSE